MKGDVVRLAILLLTTVFTLGGLAVLDAIERADYDVLRRRPKLSGAQKAMLAVRGLLPLPIRATR